MKGKNRDEIDRRSFLIGATGLVGTAVSGVGWAAGKPCPPPQFSAAGGTSASSSCNSAAAGQLPSLTLTSSSASASYPWTFGHAFRQGDVPAGHYITTSSGSFQADVRNRWPDGSVKFAVLSGITSFSQNAAISIALSTTTSSPSGSTVAEPTSLNVSVALSGAVSSTYTLQSCLGVNRSTWTLGSAGRVRQILGPAMSEFHYYRPTTDPHLAIWFYVRAYANGTTEVETVIENGWLNVSSPGEKDYSVTVSVGGSSVYSGSLSHYSHSRWSRVDWIGPTPQVTPKHNASYLRSTRLVPNYGFTSPDSSAFSGLAAALNPVPFAQGDWVSPMGNAGYQPTIGLLPRWEALYCTSADPRAYAATISNQRGFGRWSICYRDETTGRIPRYSTYPNNTIESGWGPQFASASGGVNSYDIPHHPSAGYLPYLLEGRWSYLESLQFSASYCILNSNPTTRNISGFGSGIIACVNAPMTTRGAAWSWRTVGQAAGISPTSFSVSSLPTADAAMQNQFANSISNFGTWANANYIAGSINGGAFKNAIGWIGQYDNYSGQSPIPSGPDWWGGSWMVDFQNQALGFVSQIGIENFSDSASFTAVRNFNFLNRIHELGTESTWNFRRGAVYARPYLVASSPSAPVFYSATAAFSTYKSVYGLSTLTSNAGDPLMNHSSDTVMNNAGSTSDTGTGYWASAIAALAFAVDAGVPGAAAAFGLVTAAPNYSPSAAGANNSPQWAIIPRS